MFKSLFTEFCHCACAKKVIRFIRIRHTCVALIHKKAALPLETSSEINFEFIKCVKKCKMSPFDKTIGNIKYLVIFDLSRFSITFFLLPKQVDLLLFLLFLDQKCAQTKMQQHIDFPMEISVLKFQAWPI